MRQVRCACAGVLLLATGTAGAHQDYAGDVYPRVSVEGNHFVITFKDNREEERTAYRNIYSREGEKIGPRRPATYPPFFFERLGHPQGDKLVVRRPSIRQFGASDAAWRGIPGGVTTLSFGEPVNEVNDVIAHGAELLVLTAAGRPPEVVIFRFDMPSGRLLERRALDSIDFYHPSLSNLLAYRDGYLASWMANDSLRLGFWVPGRQPVVVDVTHGEWNTWPTMDVIGDDLLIAFHTPGKEAYAVIVTVHVRLPLSECVHAAAMDGAASWTAERVEKAFRGRPELVRVPVVVRATGEADGKTPVCIAATAAGACGPAVVLAPSSEVAGWEPSRTPVSVAVADGTFTGRKIGSSWEFDLLRLREVNGPDDVRLQVLLDLVQTRPPPSELRDRRRFVVVAAVVDHATPLAQELAWSMWRQLRAKGFPEAEVLAGVFVGLRRPGQTAVVAARAGTRIEAEALLATVRRDWTTAMVIQLPW